MADEEFNGLLCGELSDNTLVALDVLAETRDSTSELSAVCVMPGGVFPWNGMRCRDGSAIGTNRRVYQRS